jgi:hypothetical protein
MALNLNHFNLAEDPNLYYRRVGMPAVDDFLARGAIAGTQKYGTEAYFLRGAEWATSGAPYRITVDMSRLDPINNPLYGELNLNRYLTQEGAFPLGEKAMRSGQYPRLTPNPSPSFWSAINPANRAGIKIDDTRTGKVLYDRLKPITQTPILTTLRNAGVEARLAGGLVADAAGPIVLKTGGVAPLLLDAPEYYSRENSKRLAQYPEGYTGSREATASEIAAMLGIGTAKSLGNAVTMGAAMSGTGKDRPKRGPARMEDSGTEAYRRMIERANNWKPE